MYSFKNDYSEGAHPSILNALVTSNFEQEDGYGEDFYSRQAVELIKQKLGRTDVDVHFITGGTQTNLISIAAFLKPHEAAIAAVTGHIFTHETGAIEATGHKVIAIEAEAGKLTTAHLQTVLDGHTDEHMVKPKLVYISNSTEIGTIYTKRDLVQLREFCNQHGLILFMDGARLGSALCAEGNDLHLEDIPGLVDAFYIGGTKNGALLGEALVICKQALKEDFRFHLKQRGALLAKGRILGIQFLELFRDNLFFDLAAHANEMALRLKEAIVKLDIPFLTDSPTNQIFPVLTNTAIDELQKNYAFLVWAKVDDNRSAIRLVTSWATKEEVVDSFIAELEKLMKDQTAFSI